MLMVSMSPSSAEVAAEYGLKALRFSQGDWSHSMKEINAYRSTFEAKHGTKAPPFMISDFVVCVDTEEQVGEYTDEYFAKQFYQVANHYEWGGEHFKSMPSYATYVALGDAMNAAGGPEKAYKDYIGGNLIGTPEQLIEIKEVETLLDAEVKRALEPFAIYERPRRTALLPRALTEEAGELTPTLKTKMRVVQVNWKDQIDYLFDVGD